ncbi:hypothetical protein BHF71_02095 [Vulcanibacillus modesticaldus]|uniref:DUF2283 domain-containing protein n=1 Tax=Vulcanibacillus modesticaldus TaxID=337097 RepID=A0A1D2YUK7_9BACI|nr:DUF2283 domain-containing protein [Vulcanibacillus modesticaldus]OEF99398.1 hypothetical protein BHF71_02095 [Vulcanibacillus modesticaldus]
MFAQIKQDHNFRFNYDSEHDVLYVYFGEPKISYEDETAPGVFIRIAESDETITGVIILDYKKKNRTNIKIPVNINFNEINLNIN